MLKNRITKLEGLAIDNQKETAKDFNEFYKEIDSSGFDAFYEPLPNKEKTMNDTADNG